MAVRKIPKLEEMQKKAYVAYFAEELPQRGYQVHLDAKGNLRAVCRACGRKYVDRFAYALDHAEECAAAQDKKHEPPRPGEVVATFDLPKPGSRDKRRVVWAGPDGKERTALVVISVPKQPTLSQE